jgi:hypothetical protein
VTTPVANIEAKLKDPTLPSAKKVRVHFKLGRRINHDTGELVAFDWRMDKRANRYWEKVRDVRGRFVHWVDHELLRHRDHGSARRKPPSKD